MTFWREPSLPIASDKRWHYPFQLAGWIALTGLLAALVLWWFGSFRSATIMGDDLLIWSRFQKDYSWIEVLYRPFAISYKFRPTWAFFQFLEYRLTNFDYNTCLDVNMMLQVLVGLLVFRLTRRISGKASVALTISIVFTVSRFSYYNVLQVSGTLEALSLIFFILLLSRSITYARQRRPLDAVCLTVLFAILIHTHERFLVLMPFLVLLILIYGDGLLWQILPIGFIVIAFIINISAKIALGMPVLMGTGNQPIAFSLGRIATFAAAGFANVFGISIGPEHLTALSFEQMGVKSQIQSIMIPGCFLAIFLAYFISAKVSFFFQARQVLPWLFCLGLLIGSASVAIHQEMRWLYAPYLLVLLGVAGALGRVRHKLVRPGLLCLCLLLVVNQDHRFRSRASSYFFVRAQAMADQVYDTTIRRHPDLVSKRICIVGTQGFVDIRWVLLGGNFFYYHLGRVDVHFADAVHDVDFTKEPLVLHL